jgi:chorismate mutase
MTVMSHITQLLEHSDTPPRPHRGGAVRRFLSANAIANDPARHAGALIALTGVSAGLRLAMGATRASPWLIGSGIGSLILLAAHRLGDTTSANRYRTMTRLMFAGYTGVLTATRLVPQRLSGAVDLLGMLDAALGAGVLAILADEHRSASRPRSDDATAGAAAPHLPAIRGVRGATTVESNTREAVLAATHELLEQIVSVNAMHIADIASVLFSTTPDIDAVFPAVAARERGWTETALMCTHEMSVPGSLPRCIRVLIHWNTPLRAAEVRHVYLRGARVLRPDLALPAAPAANDQPATKHE